MKTEDLIKALAADAKSVAPPVAQTLAMAIGIGTLIAAVLFYGMFGVRDQFMHLVTSSPRFDSKFILTLSLAIPAFVLVGKLARPDFNPGKDLWWLALAPALMAAAVIAELIALPADAWKVHMIGHNAVFCLILIPTLSLAPLVAALYALRQGAPTHPVAAGAVGGLLSAGIAATLYAAHCPDDSPLFLAVWYTIATLIMMGIGALLGPRILRW